MTEAMTGAPAVPGWLTDAEADALRALARGRVVLEFGSYRGRSTVALAQAARLVVAVDHHRGDAGTGPADTLGEFLANLGRFGVRDRVVPVVAPIDAAGPLLAPGAFGLVFVDDAHDYAAVLRSTRLALRCLAPGGTVAWHDYQYEGVAAAVAALGVTPDGVTDSLAWWTRPEGETPC